MHAGVLANVERVQVESEGLDFAQQRRDEFGKAVSAVCVQTVADEDEIFFELLRGFVGVLVL